ncbi:hypothetical protein AX17_005907 [Amanita inopinata Kibby_2008]|nr:hypothetical protein AX17_005907 [Amanita inopinata Kibby_2008]
MSLVCPHIRLIAALSPPLPSQPIHREECTQCFDTHDLPDGIDLCLNCFNGACPHRHSPIHVSKLGHPYTLNFKRVPIRTGNEREGRGDEGPPPKMVKLAIVEENEKDKYDYVTTVKCWLCDPAEGRPVPEAANDPKIKSLTNTILSSLSSSRQSDIKSWEEEIHPCEHTLTLSQDVPASALDGRPIPIPDSASAHCWACYLTSNLWLCLTCGNLACGRKQFGGHDGNGHALTHFESTGHPVSVKLGTITPEGEADIYCYACNDAKIDPDIATHLSTFGITLHTMKKTEKSMTELQIEHNLSYDFSLVSSSTGKSLQPLSGPGLTGLANLGNTCYMASVMQALFSLDTFRKRYHDSVDREALERSFLEHAQECPYALPADCLECQMRKMAEGLLSGRYASALTQAQGPDAEARTTSQTTPPPTFMLKPHHFKSIISHAHPEFSSSRQQDAEEFLGHLLSLLRRYNHKHYQANATETDATRIFDFGVEQRLQCGVCKRVRYRVDRMDRVSVGVPAIEKKPLDEKLPEQADQANKEKEKEKRYEPIPLTACLDSTFLTHESLEYTCPSSCGKVVAGRQLRFDSFPEVLVVHAKKVSVVGWVPTKLDIPVLLPDNDVVTLDERYLGKGLQPGEVELPDDEENGGGEGVGEPELDQEALAQLEAMGFPRIRSEKALLATENTGAEVAMEWLLAHMDDPDIDVPIDQSKNGRKGKGTWQPSPEQVAMLSDMGFTTAQASKALKETSGDIERAVEWLFSHPDDTGEDASLDIQTQIPSHPAQETETRPGTRTTPVRYALKAFISHKGPSAHSGHYVAHIKVNNDLSLQKQGEGGGTWALFNDEKVVRADEESVNELKKLAYLYVFERI